MSAKGISTGLMVIPVVALTSRYTDGHMSSGPRLDGPQVERDVAHRGGAVVGFAAAAGTAVGAAAAGADVAAGAAGAAVGLGGAGTAVGAAGAGAAQAARMLKPLTLVMARAESRRNERRDRRWVSGCGCIPTPRCGAGRTRPALLSDRPLSYSLGLGLAA